MPLLLGGSINFASRCIYIPTEWKLWESRIKSTWVIPLARRAQAHRQRSTKFYGITWWVSSQCFHIGKYEATGSQFGQPVGPHLHSCRISRTLSLPLPHSPSCQSCFLGASQYMLTFSSAVTRFWGSLATDIWGSQVSPNHTSWAQHSSLFQHMQHSPSGDQPGPTGRLRCAVVCSPLEGMTFSPTQWNEHLDTRIRQKWFQNSNLPLTDLGQITVFL